MLSLPRIDERDCQKCSLRENCGRVVWGEGSENAKLVIVAESPGKTEDLLNEPFVSREGKLLAKTMAEAGINLDDCYLTYAVKCPSLVGDIKAGNIKACAGWLWQELKTIQPKVVLTLGSIPARLLIKRKPLVKLQDVVGEFHRVEYLDALFASWYSPGAMLVKPKAFHKESVNFFRKVWEKVCGNQEHCPPGGVVSGPGKCPGG